jgi:hypothetical protein
MDAKERTGRPRPHAATVDEMSQASFPASDAPAVWTWDPDPKPAAVAQD